MGCRPSQTTVSLTARVLKDAAVEWGRQQVFSGPWAAINDYVTLLPTIFYAVTVLTLSPIYTQVAESLTEVVGGVCMRYVR